MGIKVDLKNNICKIYGKGIDGYKYKNNLTLNAENSGTLGRLILGFLINTTKPINLIGDKSLSTRDFKRISDPLSKFGGIFRLKNKKNLPLTIYSPKNLRPISYLENKGSAQCKSAVIFAGLNASSEDLTATQKKSLSDVKLSDVSNHYFGTSIADIDPNLKQPIIRNDILIPRDTKLPYSITKEYSTLSDGQESIKCDVTQSEHEETDMEFVTVIKSAELKLPPGRPAGQPIEVTLIQLQLKMIKKQTV